MTPNSKESELADLDGKSIELAETEI